MTIKCWYSPDGGTTWEGPFFTERAAHTSDRVFTTGYLEKPDPELGMYEAIVATNPPPDIYYTPDPEPQLALTGPANAAGTQAQETNTYTSWSLERIRDQKIADGEGYAELIAFRSAQVAPTGQPNDHLYIRTDQLNYLYYVLIGTGLADWLKDIQLGSDSTQGPQPEDPQPEDYWRRDPVVDIINSSNGNLLTQHADEVEWGRVIKAIFKHVADTREVGFAYRQDVLDTYDLGDRAALVALEPSDSAYTWPPTYPPV